MIGYIKGTCLEVLPGKVTLAIEHGAGHMLGYDIFVPQQAYFVGELRHACMALYIYTHTKQDGADLYGFLTLGEKNLFISLLGANKIGPKSALNALSYASVDDILDAILQERISILSKIPGIGKKTAERLVLDLKDVIAKRHQQGLYGGVQVRRSRVEATPLVQSQALSALRDLGFGDAVIYQALQQVEKNDGVVSLEDTIRKSLQYLSTHSAKNH